MEDKRVYTFNLLKDEAVNIDTFADKTHERIAETLHKIISNDNSDGVTIGLEGPWGSGKSTVVSILKEKLEKDNFHYFYFDAWAHEGDPLRRIFLEMLIEQLDEENEFDSIKKEISNRKRKTKTTTKQTATSLGKQISLSVLFVPFGAALISAIDLSLLTLKWTGNINWLFWIGFLSSLTPIWILLKHLLKHGGPKKNPEKWMFLESEIEKETTQEISEEEERSSIEFEYYFKQIIRKKTQNGNLPKRLLMVIDNLDRIDSNDSLKIWSTLQTFLQQRNPSNLDSALYNKIWIIVPYDQQGLAKLWQINENHISCAKSFFEKCFQLRLDVPKPVMTGWESFAREKIDEALMAWPENEKEEILSVLKNTRENLADIPTPRQIKTYINQVGLLKQHAVSDIPTQSIAYYVIFKYINENIDSDKIRENILKKELPRKNDLYFLSADCDKHLAGLVFGVNSTIGQQLLLEPIIENALKSGNGELLKEILDKHDEGFWSVFQYHIGRIPDINSMLPYSITVYNTIWKTDRSRCSIFINRLKYLPLSFPNEDTINFYIPLIRMLIETGHNIEDKWLQIIKSLEVNSSKDGFNVSLSVDFLSRMIQCLDVKELTKYTYNIKDLNFWEQWETESEKKKLKLFEWVSPPDSIKDELATQVLPGQPIANNILKIHIYSLYAGITGWAQFANACAAHIKWSQGTPNGNGHTGEVISVLQELLFMDEAIKAIIESLIKTGEFHNFVSHQHAKKSVLYSSIMMAYLFGNKLHSISIPGIANAETGIKLIREFWTIKNPDNAKNVWLKISKHKQYSLVWSMAEDSKNKLLTDLIPLGIKNDPSRFFNVQDGLKKLHNAIAIIEDEQEKEIVQCFISHSNILVEIEESENLNVIQYSHELFLILDMIDNTENFETNIITKLMKITKDEWIQAFDNDTYLLPLIVAVKEKNQKFILENNYFDGILDYASRWIISGIEPTKWIIENWLALVKVLNRSFQKHFITNITEIIWQNLKQLQLKTFESFQELFNVQKTISKEKQIMQKYLDNILQSEIDFNKLKIVDITLSKDKKNIFLPEKYYTDVITAPINNIYQSEKANEEHKDMIIRIAERFHVSIIEINETGEKEDSSVEVDVEEKP